MNELLYGVSAASAGLVGPDAEHCPVRKFQLGDHSSVPCAICLDLLAPPGAVRRGPSAVVRAPVPEAPIHEHCDTFSEEDDVGATPDARRWPTMNSISEAPSVEFLAESNLARSVPLLRRLHTTTYSVR